MNRKHPIRVVHLITDLDRGGAQSMLCRLAARIDREDIETIVISMTTRGALSAELEARGIRVAAIGMRRGLAGCLRFIRLVRCVRRHRPAVLQTWLFYADLMGLFAGLFARVPTIVWNIRAAELDPKTYSPRLMWTLKLLARLSPLPSAVVVNSNAGRKAIQRLGYRPRKVAMIPNGFDLDRFAPDEHARTSVRAELGVVFDAPLVGFVARFHPVKDHETFFRAAARVHASRPDVHFVLAGHRVDRGNEVLRRWIAAGDLEGVVHLLGDRADVARLTASFDVATLCSQSEAFPNVLGEAMACGVPCVATSVGECAHLIADTGSVVEPRDPATLARAWSELLARPTSERRSMGRAARQRIVDLFDITHVADEYGRLYTSLAGRDSSQTSERCTTHATLKH